MASARADLAARQQSLVAALVSGVTPPAGVDRRRVEAQALALLRKRSRSVAKRHPELAVVLGPGFWPAFQDYAKTAPPPDCTASDARAFARYLTSPAGRGHASSEARSSARALLRRGFFSRRRHGWGSPVTPARRAQTRTYPGRRAWWA